MFLFLQHKLYFLHVSRWVSLPSPVLVPKKEEEKEKGKEEQDWGSALNSAKATWHKSGAPSWAPGDLHGHNPGDLNCPYLPEGLETRSVTQSRSNTRKSEETQWCLLTNTCALHLDAVLCRLLLTWYYPLIKSFSCSKKHIVRDKVRFWLPNTPAVSFVKAEWPPPL